MVRVRPFVRIAGNLSLTVSDLSAGIPPFNPQRMLAENTPGGTATPDEAAGGRTRRRGLLRHARSRADDAAAEDRVEHTKRRSHPRVRAASEWSETERQPKWRAAPTITGIKLAYAGTATADPYAGSEARVVPENITLLPKTTNQTTGGNAFNEKNVVAKKGETVASILRDLGATPDDIGRGHSGAGSART